MATEIQTELQKLAVKRSDGTVSIVSIITRAPLSQLSPDVAKAHGFSRVEGGWERQLVDVVDAELDRLRLKDNTGWRLIDAADVPPIEDRLRFAVLRAAYVDDGKKVAIDLRKARDCWRDDLRAQREPLLGMLDIEMLRALETVLAHHPEIAGIAAKKQALRDVTDDPAIELATTPDELIEVRPAALSR